GVDSSVCAALMVREGYDCIGMTMRLWKGEEAEEASCSSKSCCGSESVEDARLVCETLGIPFYAINFREEFWKEVVQVFADEYYRGRTPSPCILCNEKLKFNTLYKKALAFTNHPHHILNQLAHAYLHMRKMDEAEKLFRQILGRDSSDCSATLGLGACMQKRNMPRKALLIYQSGKAWEKKDPHILHQAGICALRTQKYTLASQYFSQVMRIQGPSPQLLSYYGLSLECQRRWTEAEQNYFQFIELFPSESHGYRSLAWLFGVGLSSSLSLDQCYKYACVSLKMAPDPSSWEIMSACEARKGNFTRAHQILEYLLSSDKDGATRVRRQHAMRNLRKNLPLVNQHVLRNSLV
ncbi:MAG: hypothetical protein K940chlam2_01728, partial [Chlamydiae bacterium]|nr:hypothetical protein [Chlamydiota bacterium]